MRKKILLVTITLVAILLLFSFVSTTGKDIDTTNQPKIEETDYEPSATMTYWGEQTIPTNVHYPGIMITPTNRLVVLTHSFICISDNYGVNWTYLGDCFTPPFYGGDHYWACTVMPNGSLMRTMGGHAGYGVGPQVYYGYNNGENWSFSHNITNFGLGGIQRLHMYNRTLYAAFMDGTFTTGNPCIIYSNDNGTTWSKMGNDIRSGGADEFEICPLYGNGTWRTIHRDEEGWPLNYITHNSGQTWTSTGEDNPASMNKNPSLVWLDNETIILIEECNDGEGTGTYIYYSTDNMASWTKIVKLGNEGTPASGNAYCDFVAFPKGAFGRPDTMGGIGYAVWMEDNNARISGCWIANNATIGDWEWPPGPYPPPEFYSQNGAEDIQILSINGNNNGTTIYDSTPTFNWTKISNASQYWLQVATDNTFTNLVVNITNINQWNYPSNYNENSTRVSFTLPDTNKLSVYDNYYCRVKALSR